jgi:hypothetical protein
MRTSYDDGADFVLLLRDFLSVHTELSALFEVDSLEDLSFASVRDLVGDETDSVLYRLKERSHRLFRSGGNRDSLAVRREALFDLVMGSLFHESMQLRESLYQREVYGPRLASLKADSDDDAEDLFIEFERMLTKGASRLNEVVAEIRILLAQTRDQLRQILVDRAGDRIVSRYLLRRRDAVAEIFPEGVEGLLEVMHGSVAAGLVEAARSLLESAYFVEASQMLREAIRLDDSMRPEIQGLLLYAEGMQAILDEDYARSLGSIEAWAECGGPEQERDFARLAGLALSRLDRLVSIDGVGQKQAEQAKALQLRLETGRAG